METIVSNDKPSLANHRAPEMFRALGRSTFFGVVANLAQLSTRIVMVPIAVAHLGLGGYGIWNIIMAAAAYMRFGSIGCKSAYQKYAADATGDGDFTRASRLISTGTFVMLLFSVAGLIPIALFSRSLASLIGIPQPFIPQAAASLTLLALIMILSNGGAAYESIVMGGHRVDLVRKFNTVSTIVEAIAIIVLLECGKGLLAMALVMALSELAYVIFCFLASKRVLPSVTVSVRYIQRDVIPELITFAGSYQLKGMLELVYAAILPIVVLSSFGADSAGIYAIASRLAIAALLPQEALLQPILSSGSMVHARGSADAMRTLITNAFKALFVLSLPLLAFISLFGNTILLAWTGQTHRSFQVAMLMLSSAGLFKSISFLASVFYRASGRSVLDNVAQGIRIVLLATTGLFGLRLGFIGVLAGLAVVELVSMIVMTITLLISFEGLTSRCFLSEFWRTAAAATLMLSPGVAVLQVPLSFGLSCRPLAVLQLGLLGATTIVAFAPALLLTRSLSGDDFYQLTYLFRSKECARA